jgi:NagD protein
MHHNRTILPTGYSGLLVDMDGILQACGSPIPGAADFVRLLQDDHVPFAVVTNECRLTNEELSEKLFGLLNLRIPPSLFYTAANSVAHFLLRWTPASRRLRVLVVGERGLVTAVSAVAEIVDGPVSDVDVVDIDYVVIGARFSDDISALEAALDAVRRGAKVLYTCPDTYEVDGKGRLRLGMPLPAVETIASVTGVSGFCCGKPNANMARQGLRRIGLLHDELAKVLFLGDSLDTDVRLATENGLDSALVLSAGQVSRDKLAKSCFKPNFVFNSVADFAATLPGLLQVNKALCTAASTIPE